MEHLYKILLVEPDLELGKTICQWLKEKAQVTHILDMKEAQKQAKKSGWDLVIADIHSNEINNLDITQIVKQANPSTAILIIAENIKVDFILMAMQYHADGLFFKTLDANEFVPRALQLAEETKLKRAKDRKVILAIGAHPDDVELGCGGTLAKMRAEGSEINILTLSLGGEGGSPDIRRREALKAAKLQGAQLFLGDFFDTKIKNDIETIQFIRSIVQKVKPTYVFTHSCNDSHQDHVNVYQATVTACRQLPNLFSYLSPSCTVDFRPNIFINIDEHIKTKLKVLSVYKSQLNDHPYLHTDMIKATARYWGRFGKYNLVEPMEVVKEQS